MKIVIKNKKIFVFFALLIIYLSMSFFLLYNDTIHSAERKKEWIVKNQISENKIEFTKNERVARDITIFSEKIDGFSLAFAKTYTDQNAIFKVRFLNSNEECLFEKEIPWEKLKDEGYTNFNLNKEYRVGYGENCTISVELIEGKTGALYFSDLKCFALNISDYSNLPHEVACRIYDRKSTHSSLVFGIIVVGIVLLIFSIFILFSTQFNLEYYFALSSFIIGIIYMFLWTPYTAPDEEQHYATAYEYSSELLQLNSVDNDNHVIVRKTDYEYYLRTRDVDYIYLTRSSYDGLGSMFFINSKNDESQKMSDKYVLLKQKASTNPIIYSPQIIGITIGRILELNGVQTFMLGRFFALCVHIFVMYLAIKTIPFGKLLLFTIGLLPISMELAASVNYDALIMPICFFLIAYILHLAYVAEKISIKNYVVLIIAIYLISIVKYVYLVLLLLGLLIPAEKFGSARKKAYAAIGLVLLGISFVFATNIGSVLSMTGKTSTNLGYTTDKKYLLSNIYHEPLHFLGIMFRTIEQKSSEYISEALGAKMGWRAFGVSSAVQYSSLLYLMLGIHIDNSNIIINVKEKIKMISCAVLVIFGVLLSMLLAFTTANSDIVNGVQGRYLLPAFLLLLLSCQNKLIEVKKDLTKIMVAFMIVIDIFSIIEMFRYVV